MKVAVFRKVITTYRDTFFYIFLIFSTAFVYSRTAINDFVNFDDPLQLTEQSHVLSGLTWKNLLFSFSPEAWCAPFTWLTYTAGYTLFGLNPGAFHVMSLILHLASSIMLFSLLKSVTGEFWKSAFVGTLFALHPINVESVAWIAELNNVLSGLFFMLTLLTYNFYIKRSNWKRYVLALLVFELGLLAKPVLMTLPFILFLLDFWPLKRTQVERTEDNRRAWGLRILGVPIPRLILEKIPFLVLSLFSLAENLFGANKRMGLYNPEIIPISLRISNALVSCIKYLGKLFWPHDLAIFYPYPSVIPLWQLAGACLVLVLVTIFALRAIFQHPYYLVGWLWFLGGLVPFLGIYQAGAWPEMADRYAYLPCIGIFIALCWGIYDLLARWRYYRTIIAMAGSGVILILMVLTWNQVGFWKNSETLFRHALNVTRNNYLAHNHLGVAFLERGDMEGAIEQFMLSIKITPNYKYAHLNLAEALCNEKKYNEAIIQLRECLRIDPHYGDAYNNLGNVMATIGNFDEAMKNYNEALQIDPHQAMIYNNIGVVFYQKGNIKKAIEYYQKALHEIPGITEAIKNLEEAKKALKGLENLIARTQKMIDAEPNNPSLITRLGNIYRQQGEYDEAIGQYQKALSIQPKFIQAMYGLVLVYSERREYVNASKVLQNIRQFQPDNPEVYYNIACIYAKQNKVDESIFWLKQAIEKGFNNWSLLEKDSDLDIIRNTKYYKELKRNY